MVENSTISNIIFEVIENNTFKNCSKISTIAIPSTISVIGISSSQNCISHYSISFPASNLQILERAFENCIYLLRVDNIISKVAESCFHGCSRLSQVTLREGSEMSGIRSFENCCSLASISIPLTFRIIAEYVFDSSNKLKSIIFSSETNLESLSINSFSVYISLTNISDFESSQYKCIDNTDKIKFITFYSII